MCVDSMLSRSLNLRLAYAIFAIAFGSGFQHGYNTGVLNAPQALISKWIRDCDQYNITAYKTMSEASEAAPDSPEECNLQVASLWGLIVAAFCIGGVVGGSLVGLVSEKLGRKGGLLFNNSWILFVAGMSMFAAKYADTYLLLIFGRFLIGLNAGLNAGIAPMYLSEISPVALRGTVGTAYQLVITISILLSQVLGMKGVLGNEEGWPFLLGITIIPGLIQQLTLPACPESPKYLLLVREEDGRTEHALKWLRGEDDVQEELEEMRAEREAMKADPPVTLRAMLTTSSLRRPLVIAVMMMLAQQLSGINAAFFFSTSIFKSAGMEEEWAQMATLGVGLVNVVMTFASLALIDSSGRKTLMIAGLGIMDLATWGLLICLVLEIEPILSVLSLIIFVAGFATGPGSIPWFFVTELFAQSGRPTATSIAVVTNWLANFMVGFLFEPLRLALGGYVFGIFIVIQIIFMVYIVFAVPETKNRSIEDITAHFK